MKRLLLVLTLVLAVGGGAGCSHIPIIGKHFRPRPTPGAPKPTKYIAKDVENEFFQRTVQKRTSELVSQGMTQDEAHAQAVAEFKAKYTATAIAQSLP